MPKIPADNNNRVEKNLEKWHYATQNQIRNRDLQMSFTSLSSGKFITNIFYCTRIS